MDLDQETAKELVKSVIDGFEEESIVNAESVTLFLCRECLPYLTKMNIPANIVQAVNGLAEKNEDLTAAGSLTDLVIAQDGRLQSCRQCCQGSNCCQNKADCCCGTDSF